MVPAQHAFSEIPSAMTAGFSLAVGRSAAQYVDSCVQAMCTPTELRRKLWSKNGVHFILTNEIYTGTLIWGTAAKDKADPVRVEKAFPGIVFPGIQ